MPSRLWVVIAAAIMLSSSATLFGPNYGIRTE